MQHDQNDPVCQSQSPPLKRLWCIKMAIKQQFAIECGQTGNYMQSVCDITVINGDKSANIATAVLCPSAPLYEDIHNRQKFTLTSSESSQNLKVLENKINDSSTNSGIVATGQQFNCKMPLLLFYIKSRFDIGMYASYKIHC